MVRSVEVVSEESLASAIGLLYQRKKAGAALIRVLEKYQRRGCRSGSGIPRLAARGSAAEPSSPAHFPPNVTGFQQKLDELYLRRAVVDELIRSIEAYAEVTPTLTGRRAGPQANH
jgi:hypothetical protein